MTTQTFVSLLADVAVRGGLAIACAAGIAWLLRNRSAAVRAAVWRGALVVLAALPLAGALAFRWSIPVLPVASVVPVVPRASESFAITPEAAPEEKPRSRAPSSGTILLAMWLAGVLVLGGRLFASHRTLARVVRSTRPLDAGVHGDCRAAELAIGMHELVTYRVSGAVPVPLACGWHRPTVVLPDAFIDWSPEIRRGVLVHELSHLQRNDPPWHTIGAFVRILYWWHPLAWWAVHRLRAESEHACDEAVIRSGERPSGYADTLLTIATQPFGEIPRAALAMVRSGGLEQRIEAILTGRGLMHPLGRGPRVALAGLAGILGLVLAFTQPVAIAGSSSAAAEAPTPRPEGDDAPSWIDRARHVDPIDVEFRNDPGNPVQIRGAKARIVVGVSSGVVGVTMPELAVENVDARRTVSSVVVGFDLPNTRDRMREPIRIAPRGTTTLRLPADKWSAVTRMVDSGKLVARIVAVEFEDGGRWGIVDTPAPPAGKGSKSRGDAVAPTPRPPDDQITPPDWTGPSRTARIRNLDDPSVVIVEARTPLSPATLDGEGTTWLPSVRIENRSAKEVVAVRLRYKAEPEGHGVSGFTVEIAPGSATDLRKTYWIRGRAEDMAVQLLGVRFRDGTVRGSMGSRIDARWPWVEGLETH